MTSPLTCISEKLLKPSKLPYTCDIRALPFFFMEYIYSIYSLQESDPIFGCSETVFGLFNTKLIMS